MKLCWDNIENMYLTCRGNFKIYDGVVWDICICKECGEEFLGQRGKINKYCDVKCSGKAHVGEKNPFYGKKHTEEIRKKMSNSLKGRESPNKGKFGKDTTGWKGGFRKKGFTHYDTYAPQVEWHEKVRRNKEDPNIMEVKCFKCDEWFIPTLMEVRHRIEAVKGKEKGEQRFYCSDECKNSCSIYGKKPEQIMKQDAIRAGRLLWSELRREVQPELRQMVLERDEHKCIKCSDSNNLQCHHILPVNIEPLLSADIDNCITLCKECHVKVHKEIDGCGLNQLYIEEC